MATLKICKLHFTSQLHIGDKKNNDYGISLKSISSDSMLAAITSVLAKAGKAIPENGDLGFAISSLFPFYQETTNSKPVYFFPQPLQARMLSLTDLNVRKKIKKIKWLDTGFYENVLGGKRLFDNNEEDLAHIYGEYLAQDKVPSDFVKSNVVQRVLIKSRVGKEDALPYYVDQISFKGYSGLFFVVDGDTCLLEQAMPLLAMEGIGTDRNVGNGFFEYDITKIELNLPSDASHSVSLSLLIPESKEQFDSLLDSEFVAYDIERRGGWITTYPFNSFRKNAIYGFVPGSVFSMNIKNVTTIGKIVNLRPDIDHLNIKLHSIWRSGKSIMLPIII